MIYPQDDKTAEAFSLALVVAAVISLGVIMWALA